MDSDRVLVMELGKVREFSEPYDLLRDPQSAFSQLVLQSGIQATWCSTTAWERIASQDTCFGVADPPRPPKVIARQAFPFRHWSSACREHYAEDIVTVGDQVIVVVDPVGKSSCQSRVKSDCIPRHVLNVQPNASGATSLLSVAKALLSRLLGEVLRVTSFNFDGNVKVVSCQISCF